MKTEAVRKMIQQQLLLYPCMQIQDMYKLVYQGVMGSGHAVPSEEAAGIRLRQEMLGAGAGFRLNESLAEEISADGSVLRINLRPFLSLGGDPEALLKAFVRTGAEYRGSRGSLMDSWRMAVQVQELFQRSLLSEYFEDQRRMDFPAVHHSSIYRELYDPAYRVALRSICIEEGVLP